MKDPRIKHNTSIEFFLNGKSLGKDYVQEGSTASDRIAVAKELRIEYYDGFILDNGRLDSRNVLIGGKPVNDFKELVK